MGNMKNTRGGICQVVSSHKAFYPCSVQRVPPIGSFLIFPGLWISSKAHNVGLPVWGEGVLLILWGIVVVCELSAGTWRTGTEAEEREDVAADQPYVKFAPERGRTVLTVQKGEGAAYERRCRRPNPCFAVSG